MSVKSRTPPSTTNLQSSKFQIIFPRITSATYFCQAVNIPGISTTPVLNSTPFADLYKPGDKPQYGNFSMEFIIDEELWGFQIIFDWIKGYSFPSDFEEYKNLYRLSEMNIPLNNSRPQYSDAQLTILSSKNLPKFRLKFIDIFPIGLNAIPLNTMLDANKPVTTTAEFKYQYYTIERL